MKILVIGSGGREHALVWKIAQSPKVSKIFCTPGNAGISQYAHCIDIPVADIMSFREFVLKEGVDLTVVGPELPLTMGIVDSFEEAGLKVFGPSRAASQLEGSKLFCKRLMERYDIPTAAYGVFDTTEEAGDYIKDHSLPLVVKADGLAGGKGVIISHTVDEALQAIDLIMKEKAFGRAGEHVVVEEFLRGEEASFLVFTDGRNILPMASSQDHKAIYDGDKGPNTGGMGAYSPAHVITREMENRVIEDIITPALRGMNKEGVPYKGVLYAGLMITEEGPKVLEFNCRFGDPETQPILMRMKTDIVPILEATIEGTLAEIEIEWDQRASVCVVMASGGYPGEYETGKEIAGLSDVSKIEDTTVFHAGTSIEDKDIVTSGGRVLGVTALGADIKNAVDMAYKAVEAISWEGVYYRHDIGAKAVKAVNG
ncbi:MAG: phosphoribosylamine--glycine ligase [Thermodesulfobacteriota bacterium]